MADTIRAGPLVWQIELGTLQCAMCDIFAVYFAPIGPSLILIQTGRFALGEIAPSNCPCLIRLRLVATSLWAHSLGRLEIIMGINLLYKQTLTLLGTVARAKLALGFNQI